MTTQERFSHDPGPDGGVYPSSDYRAESVEGRLRRAPGRTHWDREDLPHTRHARQPRSYQVSQVICCYEIIYFANTI